MTKCLVPKCPDHGDYARGLCKNCYFCAYRLILRNQTTWDKLAADGKVFHATLNENKTFNHKQILGRIDYFLGGSTNDTE